MVITITLPKVIAKRIEREAEKLGISLEEYIIEVLSRDLDPKDRAIEYIEAAKELLDQAKDELEKGDVRQAAEKTWDAATLAVKAYAYNKEGKRLTSHRELWEYVEIIANDVGDWIRSTWNEASGMHICFYEGWCTLRQVESALNHIEKLVREIEIKVKKQYRKYQNS